jgi:hypothetical protein
VWKIQQGFSYYLHFILFTQRTTFCFQKLSELRSRITDRFHIFAVLAALCIARQAMKASVIVVSYF